MIEPLPADDGAAIGTAPAPRRTPAEVFAALRQIEGSLPLADFRAEGIDLWPHLRFHAVMTEYRGSRDDSLGDHSYWARVRHKGARLLGSLPAVAAGSGPATPRGAAGERVDVLFLTDAFNRRLLIDGRWYDAFIDPYVDYCRVTGRTATIFETNQAFVRRRPPYHPTRSLSRVMLASYARSLLRARRVAFDRRFLDAYAAYRAQLAAFGMASAIVSLGTVKLEVAYVDLLRRFFRGVLQRLRPVVALTVPYNGYSGRALCLAAREQGIPVADIQHGVQSDFHPAYGQHRPPPGGFNAMPNVFLTWSDEDAAAINAWGRTPGAAEAICTGNQFVETFRSSTEVASYYDRQFRAAFEALGDRRLVLVTAGAWRRLPDLIAEVITSSPDLFFLVRFHPTRHAEEAEVRRDLARLATKNWEADQATALPLFTLLRHVDSHLTIASSTVIEARPFGVPSVIAGEIGRDYYEREIAAGHAVFHDRAGDVVAFLRQCARDRRVTTPAAAQPWGGYGDALERVFSGDLPRGPSCARGL